jgi:IMP dehydrogenase
MLRIAQEALTFDDVLLLPGYSEVVATDVSLRTQLSREIELNIPLVSAAMDTVTEWRLAIAMAQEGGIGIIHKSMSVEEQAEQVRKVKKFESGVVKDPITIQQNATIAELMELTSAHGISGVPVLDGGDLVGIVTRRDLRFESNPQKLVSAIMTPRDKLVTVKEGASSEEVQGLLHKHRIEKILVVNDAFDLCGMITVKEGLLRTIAGRCLGGDQPGHRRPGGGTGALRRGCAGGGYRPRALTQRDRAGEDDQGGLPLYSGGRR